MTELLREAYAAYTWWLLGGLVVTAAIVRRVVPEDRRRLRAITLFTLIHLALVPWAAWLAETGATGYLVVHTLAVAFGALAVIGMAMTLVFKVLLPKIGYKAPRILRDVVGGALLIMVVFHTASELGVNLAGLIATSAVVTAVIGLSLQDTLGNVIGGLMIQSDRTIQVGDWVKYGDTVARILDIRWRYTALETRNWETLLVPNGQLVKNPLLILGRRHGHPDYWRRLIEFHVDFRYAPTRVIEAVQEAVRQARIPRVADEPAPNCVLMGFHESTARYVLRYWLTDLAADDPTDSDVRVRIYFALQRIGVPLAIPAQTVFLTRNEVRKAAEAQEDVAERRQAIERMGLFRALPEEERRVLADGLRHAPFARGEVMTRQGAEAHWLYLILRGRVAVCVAGEKGLEREVAQLGDGDYFGELSLMTGEPRTATIVALTDVECYRLDREVFSQVIKRRPELAEDVARTLAERRTGLLAAREDLDQAARARHMEEARKDLVDRIRDFFGLDAD